LVNDRPFPEVTRFESLNEAPSFPAQPYGTPTCPRFCLGCARHLSDCEDNVKLRQEGIIALGDPHD
jgi:hypothetical protein